MLSSYLSFDLTRSVIVVLGAFKVFSDFSVDAGSKRPFLNVPVVPGLKESLESSARTSRLI